MNKEVTQFLNKMKVIQEATLSFIENDDKEEEKFFSYLKEQIQDNKNELKDFLHMISKISKNHHRSNDFFIKLEKIIKFYQNQIQDFLNFDIFNIFKGSKRILVFLFDQQIIHMEDSIRMIIQKDKYIKRDYDKCFCIELQNDYYSQLNEEEIEIHKENRQIGENECYICELIRNYSVEDFISYVNRKNINLNSIIPKSIYETNSFLMNKKVTLMQYSAFFGSIQIFQYLFMNGVDLNIEMWGYSIHGQNPNIIHFLEENKILPIYDNYLNEYKESIKCHHIDIMNYFKDNFYQSQSDYAIFDDIVKSSLCYFNFINIIDYIPQIRGKIESTLELLIDYDQISFFYFLSKNYEQIDSLIFHLKSLNGPYIWKYATFLHTAIEKKRKEIITILISHSKVNPNCEMEVTIKDYPKTLSKAKKPPLVIAIEIGDANIIDILLSNSNLNVNFIYKERLDSIETQKTPLVMAIEKENVEAVKVLLTRQDINVNFQSIESIYKHNEIIKTNKTSILQAAVEKGNAEIVELLLSKSEIDVNIKSIETNLENDQSIERSPLSTTIEKDNIKIANLLLSCNSIDANLKIVQTEKNHKIIKSVLNLAIEKGNVEIVKLLLSKNEIDVNFQSVESTIESKKNGKTEKISKPGLYIAIEKENIDIISLLLTKNDININNKSTISTEMIEHYEYKKKKKQSSRSKKIIRKIHEQKASLHKAVELANYEIIALLLRQPNIDINVKDEKGFIPIDYTQDDQIKQMFFTK